MIRRVRIAARAAAGIALLTLVSCPNVLMNEIIAKEAADTSKSISTFAFLAATNAKLYRDVTGTVDVTAHTIALTVPKWVPLTNLVATFSFRGATVTVNRVTQDSGVTPNDFSGPVTYTVTPASGTPVQYTVTATTGAQGLMGGVIQGTPLSLSGAVTTVAGLASPSGNPMDIVRVGTSVYIADPQFSVIWQVDVNSGTATVFAGQLGNPGYAEGTGTASQFNTPEGLATDGTNLYVADQRNERIRKIVISTALVSTLAGNGSAGSADSTPGPATFAAPNGLYYDSGNSLLYETDKNPKIVRTITLAGTVTTIVSSATPAFSAPAGLVVYGSGPQYLYVADQGNGGIYEFGTVPTYSQILTFSTTGLSAPTGITVYGSSLYVADSGNNSIQTVNPGTGAVQLFSGAGVSTGFGHVDGKDASALRFDTPNMLWVDTGSTPNTMYVTEAGNTDLRSITLSGSPANDIGFTLSGVPPGSANGTGNAARFYSPRQMASNGSMVWIGDQANQLVRSMDTASASVGTVAGQIGNATEQNGTGSSAGFNFPAGMTTDGKFLYVCDQYGMTIRKVDIATGAVTTIAGSDGAAGFLNGVGTAARFERPVGITTDGTSLYIADQNCEAIRQIVIATGVVTTVAGAPEPPGTGPFIEAAGEIDGTGTSARFSFPIGITTDGVSLIVADRASNVIRRVR